MRATRSGVTGLIALLIALVAGDGAIEARTLRMRRTTQVSFARRPQPLQSVHQSMRQTLLRARRDARHMTQMREARIQRLLHAKTRPVPSAGAARRIPKFKRATLGASLRSLVRTR